MICSKEVLKEKAVELLKKIPYYDPLKFEIHLDYVTYDMIPSINICGNEYHLDTFERGQLISRETTTDVKKVLYWILEYSICQYAGKSIWDKYSDPVAQSLTYTEQIKQDERNIKFNSFKYIGDVYFDWYCQSRCSKY